MKQRYAGKAMTVVTLGLVLIGLLPIHAWAQDASETAPAPDQTQPIQKVGPPSVKVLQIVESGTISRKYTSALPTLLGHVAEETSVHVERIQDVAASFEDERIFDYPFIYVNYADREKWEFSETERRNIRAYLERGGFIHIDAGISAAFLRNEKNAGQHHSFAEWEASPDVADAFKSIFPGRKFKPLGRSHKVFSCFYEGLPDTEKLPETVREFVINEKWPQGTYSFVGLTVKGRLAVLCSPIIAMGWGKNQLGNWETTIGFRIREGGKGLSENLETAAYGGKRFDTRREDGALDVVFCEQAATPAWVQEPNGVWRMFAYYRSTEISEFAHDFYTQLGVNIMIYALTH
ncbi:hypothetical protein BVY04_01835 [bacterium M21]|nr:hypothetical protein BVY04_01835 [bacterium M21]